MLNTHTLRKFVRRTLAFCLPHKRKLSYFDRYERSHRPLRTPASVDTNAHIGRCETTSIKEAINFYSNLLFHYNSKACRMTSEFGRISRLHGSYTRLVSSCTVYIYRVFYLMSSFRHTVDKETSRGIVRSTIES